MKKNKKKNKQPKTNNFRGSQVYGVHLHSSSEPANKNSTQKPFQLLKSGRQPPPIYIFF